MLKCWLKCRTKTWHWRVLQVRQVFTASIVSKACFPHRHVAPCAVLFSTGRRFDRPVSSPVILSENHNRSSPMSLSSLSLFLFAAIEGLISKTLGFLLWLASMEENDDKKQNNKHCMPNLLRHDLTWPRPPLSTSSSKLVKKLHAAFWNFLVVVKNRMKKIVLGAQRLSK